MKFKKKKKQRGNVNFFLFIRKVKCNRELNLNIRMFQFLQFFQLFIRFINF